MLEIQDAFLLNKQGTTWFTFDIFPDEEESGGDYNRGVSIANVRRKTLEKVAELGALDIKLIEDESRLPSHRYQVKINPKKFDPIYKDFVGSSSSDSLGHNPLHFCINGSGDFWLEPKVQFCYSIGGKSDRFKILKYLVDNSGFCTTGEISKVLKDKKEQTIRSEIGKIKRNIKKFLQVDATDVIESKKGSGYRINPKCNIAKL